MSKQTKDLVAAAHQAFASCGLPLPLRFSGTHRLSNNRLTICGSLTHERVFDREHVFAFCVAKLEIRARYGSATYYRDYKEFAPECLCRSLLSRGAA